MDKLEILRPSLLLKDLPVNATCYPKLPQFNYFWSEMHKLDVY